VSRALAFLRILLEFRSMRKIFIALILSIIVSTVNAQGKGYAGGTWGSYKFDSDDLFTSDPLAAAINIGYRFSKFDSVELRVGFGLGSRDESLEVLGTQVDVKFELKNYYSILYKPEYAINNFVFYGLLGYTESTFRAYAQDFDVDITGTKNGPSYGFGVGFHTTERMRVGLEFQELINSSTYSVRGVNFTLQSFFR
jgi:opacity protein-like surface antigen